MVFLYLNERFHSFLSRYWQVADQLGALFLEGRKLRRRRRRGH